MRKSLTFLCPNQQTKIDFITAGISSRASTKLPLLYSDDRQASLTKMFLDMCIHRTNLYPISEDRIAVRELKHHASNAKKIAIADVPVCFPKQRFAAVWLDGEASHTFGENTLQLIRDLIENNLVSGSVLAIRYKLNGRISSQLKSADLIDEIPYEYGYLPETIRSVSNFGGSYFHMLRLTGQPVACDSNYLNSSLIYK